MSRHSLLASRPGFVCSLLARVRQPAPDFCTRRPQLGNQSLVTLDRLWSSTCTFTSLDKNATSPHSDNIPCSPSVSIPTTSCRCCITFFCDMQSSTKSSFALQQSRPHFLYTRKTLRPVFPITATLFCCVTNTRPNAPSFQSIFMPHSINISKPCSQCSANVTRLAPDTAHMCARVDHSVL